MSFPAYLATSVTSTFRLAASAFFRAAPSNAPPRLLALPAPDTMLDAAFFPNIPASTCSERRRHVARYKSNFGQARREYPTSYIHSSARAIGRFDEIQDSSVLHPLRCKHPRPGAPQTKPGVHRTLLAFLLAFFFFVLPFAPFLPAATSLPEPPLGRVASLAFMLAQMSSIFAFWRALVAAPNVSSGCGSSNSREGVISLGSGLE